MPLDVVVRFSRALQRGDRVQIPKLIRWQYKMEPQQVLKVGVKVFDSWGSQQFFYARMEKDGRLRIPTSTLALLKKENESLVGCMLEIELGPA